MITHLEIASVPFLTIFTAGFLYSCSREVSVEVRRTRLLALVNLINKWMLWQAISDRWVKFGLESCWVLQLYHLLEILL